jgi:hypothetical protein
MGHGHMLLFHVHLNCQLPGPCAPRTGPLNIVTLWKMEKRILRLEDEFWRIRTETGELADAERNALRAYLDEKGFKTAMMDDNLAVLQVCSRGEDLCR